MIHDKPIRTVRRSAVVAAAFLLVSGAAAAVGPTMPGTTYVGAQVAQMDWELEMEDGGQVVEYDFQPLALIGRFGHFILPGVALEGRLGINLSDDDDMELDGLFGAYAVAHLLNVRDSFSIYVLAGATNADLGEDNTVDDTALSFGAGADLYLQGNLSIGFEYTQYHSGAEDGGAEWDLSAVSLGIRSHF